MPYRIACLVMYVLIPLAVHADPMPRDAVRYQRDLTRNAQLVWGLNAPVATFAAQIHQESRWRADAKNSIGASGLAQFMPGTSAWIAGAFPALGNNQPTNPAWAMRALVTYDQYLWDQLLAADDCSRMAMVLSAYNGGLRWTYRDQKKAGNKGLQPFIWFGQVETVNAGRSAAAFAENRAYPKMILNKWQPIYLSWGGQIRC